MTTKTQTPAPFARTYPPYDRHRIPLAEKNQVASNEPQSLDASPSPLSSESPPQSMDPNNFPFPEDAISRQDRLEAEAFNPERMTISERLDRVQLHLSREAEGERLGKRYETGKHLVFALTGILTRDVNLKNMLEMAKQAEHADVFLDRLLVQSAIKRPWYTDTFPLPPQKDIDWFARRAQPAAGHFDMIFDYLNYHYPTEVYLLMFSYLLQRHSGPGRRLRRFSPPSMSEGQQFMEEFMGPDIPPSVTALLYSTMYDAEDSEGYPAFNS